MQDMKKIKKDFLGCWKGCCEDIYKFILASVRQPADAEEIFQDVALASYIHWEDLQDMDAAVPWLYAISRNHIKTYYAQRSRVIVMQTKEVDAIIRKYVSYTDEMIIIRDFVRELPQEWAAIITLHLYYGHNATEIAELFGCNARTVQHRIKRMKFLLSRALMEDDIDAQ